MVRSFFYLILSFVLPLNCLAQIEFSSVSFEKDTNAGGGFILYYSLGVDKDTSLNDTLKAGNGSIEISKYDSVEYCNNKKVLDYKGEVVFPGSGSYELTFTDSVSYRFGNNISDSLLFKNTTRIVQAGFFDNLNSIRYQNKPYHLVQKDQRMHYSSAAVDHEGDSLHFELQVFELLAIDSVTNYQFSDTLTFNELSGEMIWDSPDSVGTYHFKMNGEEHDLAGGFKGSVQNDFIVKVVDSNLSAWNFTEISGFQRNAKGFIERTVSPGQDLDLVFSYEDSLADSVNVEAVGEPLLQNPSPFYFTSRADSNTVNASFSWTPDSSHARPYPYILTFIGKSYPSCTWHYKTVMIYVEEDSATAIESHEKEHEAQIHPNPASTQLYFTDANEHRGKKARIFDSKGRIVKTLRISGNRERINISTLDPGIYFFRVNSGKKSFSERFVVK